jgi:glycosyltransferase involved in cell wall biosynthesis
MKSTKGQNQKPIRVAFFHRKPRPLGNFSIESYFELIRTNLPYPFIPKYVEMPFESNGLWRRLANTIYSMFKQGDINHVTGDINYVTFLLNPRKTIVTIHDCGPLKTTTGLKRKIIQIIWLKIPTMKSNFIIANSTATKNDIIQETHCSSEKIVIIPISIKPIFKYNYKLFNSLEPRILQIGTAKNKNIDILIESLKDIKCCLVIIGKLDETIKDRVKQNGLKYEFLEHKLSDEEILEQYQKCDILSLISTNEGFGMPIIEANSVGRVVITSNISSMPEVAGNGALLCDPNDPKSIQTAFKEIISNPNLREQIIKNGQSNIKRFTIEKIISDHSELYTSILRNSDFQISI